jgi:hypothetical protein
LLSANEDVGAARHCETGYISRASAPPPPQQAVGCPNGNPHCTLRRLNRLTAGRLRPQCPNPATFSLRWHSSDHAGELCQGRATRCTSEPPAQPFSTVDACAKLPCNAALINGEAIVQDDNGISDFDALRSVAGTPVNTAKGRSCGPGGNRDCNQADPSPPLS